MAVADDITAGAVSLISGLGLAGVTVVDRKAAATTELDTPTLLTVSVFEDSVEYETADDDTGVAGRYRLTVTIARRNSGSLVDQATTRGMRQSIRREMLEGLAGAVVAVDWVDALPTPQFDPGLLDDGWDYSWLSFSVKTREARAP